MYPSIPAGYGVCRFNFTTLDGTGHAQMVMGCNNGAVEDATTVASHYYSGFLGSIMGAVSNLIVLDSVETVLNIGGVYSEGTHAGGDTGSAGSEPVSPAVCLLIQKQTGRLGKHFRGRMYVPGLAVELCDAPAGKVATAHLGAIQGLANDFLTGLSDASEGLVLLHRDTAVLPTDVIGLNVEQVLATQRGRQRRRAHR